MNRIWTIYNSTYIWVIPQIIPPKSGSLWKIPEKRNQDQILRVGMNQIHPFALSYRALSISTGRTHGITTNLKCIGVLYANVGVIVSLIWLYLFLWHFIHNFETITFLYISGLLWQTWTVALVKVGCPIFFSTWVIIFLF